MSICNGVNIRARVRGSENYAHPHLNPLPSRKKK
jgi:hypothetical protein